MRTLSRPDAYSLVAAFAALPVLFVMHNGARTKLPLVSWTRV